MSSKKEKIKFINKREQTRILFVYLHRNQKHKPMKVQYADYIGQTVKARYNKECPSEYGDVPMVFEGEITIYKNESGDVRFDDDWDDDNTPFSETFELL